ncbi:strubbelig-receptor family [Musa troglodytarum]|uniref:Strubbelig-receptor family n=2 Tax=Musa troglodytarum TaxID=320322 RepID=A0A9E7GYU6_9LILI|nr:strubbelig-receptor family [Musa troglodytarum]
MVLPTSTSTTSSFSSSSSFDPLLETVIIGGANVSQRNHRGFASRSIGTLVPPPLAPFTPRLHGRIAQALDSCLPRWLDISRECYLSLLFLRLSDLVRGNTDQSDVSALNVMYSSLNSPSQLTGLQLTGTMGYQLSSLISVTDFDLSKNNLNDDIPYQLPPNTTHVNLAGNALTGGIPYSVSQMTHLKNLASNQLSGQLTDMFGELSSLSLLNLQNNQLSGSVDVLATLSLENLVGGNSWSSGKPPPELKDSSSSIDIKALETSSMELKPPAADTQKSYNDNEFADKLNSTGSTDPVSLTIYALADLQAATGSFSSSCLLGQGNIGCVYKAKFNDGKYQVKTVSVGTLLFSFEMELISSKPRTEQSLVRWAASQLHDIDALAQMMDPASLRQSHCLDLLMSSLSVFRPEPEFRPAMSEVVQSLVRCVQRTSIGKRMGRDLNTSRRSNDSNHGYY